jgi:hypothetical protein
MVPGERRITALEPAVGLVEVIACAPAVFALGGIEINAVPVEPIGAVDGAALPGRPEAGDECRVGLMTHGFGVVCQFNIDGRFRVDLGRRLGRRYRALAAGFRAH